MVAMLNRPESVNYARCALNELHSLRGMFGMCKHVVVLHVLGNTPCDPDSSHPVASGPYLQHTEFCALHAWSLSMQLCGCCGEATPVLSVGMQHRSTEGAMLHLPLHFQRTSAATLPARCCSHVPCIRKLRLQHGWKPIRTISRTPYGKLSCTAAVSSPAVADSTQASDLGDTLGSGYELNMPNWNKGRRAGIILHPTSLPGPYGIGELGSEALAFIDWLHTAGMQMWQVLPLVPPDPEYFSPYSGLDANCGNPLLISIDALISEGLLDPEDAPAPVAPGPVDYPAVAAVKNTLLTKAAHRLLTAPEFAGLRELLQHWQQQNPWIEDSAVFDTLRQQSELQPLPWWQWPEDLRFRKPKALQEVNNKFQQQISEFKAIQFLFDRQWKAVKVCYTVGQQQYLTLLALPK